LIIIKTIFRQTACNNRKWTKLAQIGRHAAYKW